MIELEAFQPRPGLRVIALSAACVTRAQLDLPACWPELQQGLQEATRHPDQLCWLALPPDLDDITALAICRAAHEVWLLEDEITASPSARTLLRFRTESAPPSMGERKSVLHAPEVGCVRIWRQDGQRCVESRSLQTQEPLAGDLPQRLRTIAMVLADHAGALPNDWTQMAHTLRHNADRLRRRVRSSLAALFVLTAIGTIGLQLLSMSSWNVPMADMYSVFFLWVGGIYLWGRKLQWNNVQLAWHALADALEVQALLSSAGLRDGVVTALYQLRHRRQIEWIREALRPMTWAAHRFQPTQHQSARQLLANWVPDAQRRHHAKANRQAAKALWLSRGMKACYAAGGLLTVLVMVNTVSSPAVSLMVSAGIGLTSSLGTLLLIFNGVLGFSQDAALQRHLAFVFSHAQRCMAHEMSPHEYEELLADLGQECVQLAAERTLL